MQEIFLSGGHQIEIFPAVVGYQRGSVGI